MPLAPGTRLGPYEVISPLGASGMGEVYRARDTQLNRDVALKVLPHAMAADSERLARFTREAQVLASLNHPNIAQIYGIEEKDGTRALVMELVEGRTLDQVIPPSGVSPAQFFDIAGALAAALHAANEKHVTHRDLKPANIMITDAGAVKVLDFGLAQVSSTEPAADFESAATKLELTQIGAVIGTIPYMSPEQVEARSLDHRSDLFSLGVILYEMATGARPFRGDSSPALMASILREHPKPVSQTRSDLPEELSRLIARCLEKDPRQRVQTAQEILLELKVQRRVFESGPQKIAPAARASSFRIAVLPLACRGGNAEAADWAAGLQEAIVNGLSRFPYLSVIARGESSVAAARYLLEGGVRASPSAIRVTMRLTDSETGEHLWSEIYDHALDAAAQDVFAIQDQIAGRLVATVADQHGVLLRSMGASLQSRPVEDLTASELVLRFFAYVQTFRMDEHARLRTAFENALRREPGHAQAWACLAGIYGHEYSATPHPRQESLGLARQAAERAIELDSFCQDAWRQLAFVACYSRDREGMNAAVEKILAINPLNTVSVAAAGIMVANSGDWERGMAIVRRAMAVNPNHAPWFHSVFFADAYRRGDYVEAFAVTRRINLPSWPRSLLGAAAAAGQLKRTAEARAALEGLARLDPSLCEVETARRMWAAWYWNEADIDHLVEGFLKAKALVETSPAEAVSPAKPASGSGTSAGSGSGTRAAPAVARNLGIAVMPFSSMSSGDMQELAAGLTADITAGLSRFSYLTVISDAARAHYVIEGSVRQAGSSIRVNARLADTENGSHLWAETYTRDSSSGDLFALQDDITGRIVATIADSTGVLVRAIGGPLRDRRLEELTVEELMMRYLVSTQQFNAEEQGRLRVALEAAAAREPAHLGPRCCLVTLYNACYLNLPDHPPELLEALRVMSQRVIQLDPVNQIGWFGLALWSFSARDLPGMRAAIERSLVLNPLAASVVATVARLQAYTGDWEQGVANAQRAMDLNPNHPGWYYLPSLYNSYRIGNYEEALRIAKQINAPGAPLTASLLVCTLGRLGRAAEARAALEALEKADASLLDPIKLREAFAVAILDDAMLDDLVEGFQRAKMLVAILERVSR